MEDSLIYFNDSENMKEIKDKGVNLIVTSPPYPLVSMWDYIFIDDTVKNLIKNKKYDEVIQKCNDKLNPIWDECDRVLRDDGIICINIGDAYRKLNEDFMYVSNTSKIINYFMSKDFIMLPPIHWRKPSNKPNKFMGSGCLPPYAYVTVEEEIILIFRKKSKRNFDKEKRNESAYFWEERNKWFSDSWNIVGTSQIKSVNDKTRDRNGAYPVEIPLRLINMFSLKGDVVLDPFMGTGTTLLSCLITERKCIGYEMDDGFKDIVTETIKNAIEQSKMYCKNRIERHTEFVKEKECKHFNDVHSFKVVTSQEKKILINYIKDMKIEKSEKMIKIRAKYGKFDSKTEKCQTDLENLFD